MIKPEKSLIPSLNGLRAICILFVICHHLDIVTGVFQVIKKNYWLKPLGDLITDGQLGVNVFFIISGFLITKLLLKEEKNHQTISLKFFFYRRALRIFPAYYFVLFIYFTLQIFNIIKLSEASWLTSLTYNKYFNWREDMISSHFWSLSIEEHFYIFWPLIFLLGNKSRKITTILIIISVPLVRVYLFYFPIPWVNSLTIFLRADALSTGCFIALYFNEIMILFKKHLQKTFWISLLCLVFIRYAPSLLEYNSFRFIFIPLGTSFGTLANIFIGFIILYSVYGPKNTVYKILNSKILNHIGVLSYSLYLWQQIFIFGGDYWFTIFPYNLILTYIFALISYYSIEKYFLKFKSKFTPST